MANANSYLAFRNAFLKTGRPPANSLFGIHDRPGLKVLTRWKIGLSNLNDHRFSLHFQNTVNPLCACSLGVEPKPTIRFFLYYVLPFKIL